jgi:hypothetical protein
VRVRLSDPVCDDSLVPLQEIAISGPSVSESRPMRQILMQAAVEREVAALLRGTLGRGRLVLPMKRQAAPLVVAVSRSVPFSARDCLTVR